MKLESRTRVRVRVSASVMEWRRHRKRKPLVCNKKWGIDSCLREEEDEENGDLGNFKCCLVSTQREISVSILCVCMWYLSMIELFQSSELLRIKQTKCNRDIYA